MGGCQDAVRWIVRQVPRGQQHRDVSALGRTGWREEEKHFVIAFQERFDLGYDKPMVSSWLEAFVLCPLCEAVSCGSTFE